MLLGVPTQFVAGFLDRRGKELLDPGGVSLLELGQALGGLAHSHQVSSNLFGRDGFQLPVGVDHGRRLGGVQRAGKLGQPLAVGRPIGRLVGRWGARGHPDQHGYQYGDGPNRTQAGWSAPTTHMAKN